MEVIDLVDSPDARLEKASSADGSEQRTLQREVIDLVDSPSNSVDEIPGAPCGEGPTARSEASGQRKTYLFDRRHSRDEPSARGATGLAAKRRPDESAPVYELVDDPLPGKRRRGAAEAHSALKSSRLKEPPLSVPASTATAVPASAAAASGAASSRVVYSIDDDGDHQETGGIDDDDEPIEVEAPPEDRVLDVFPDAARVHVRALLEHYGGNHEQVVAHLIDNPAYPRSKVASSAPPRPTPAVSVRREASNRARSWTRDFSSASSFAPTREYSGEAVACLYATFPFLTKAGAKALVQAHSHYAIAHDKVVRVLRGAGTDVEQLDRFQNAMAAPRLREDAQLELRKLAPASGSASLVMRTSARSAPNAPPSAADLILREELEYAEHRLQSWIVAAGAKRDRENKKAKAQQLGAGMECACCFDEFDIDDMVSCKREGHLFCVDCLQQYASTKVFGEGNLGIDKKTKEPSLDLICFHPDGCESAFERNILVKALTNDTLRKYDEIQASLAISKAGLSDLVTCPRCGFQATLAATQKVFECPCDDCRFASCRECGEAAHVPLRCDEVTKDAIETKGRTAVEEAITAAKIRTCPKCRKPFIKSDGCNKIRCGCGVFVCYLCCEQISGYDHFCQTPLCKHESCNKCVLHSNTEKGDEIAMKKAGLHAASEVKSKMAGVTSNEINIDVDSILKQPNASLQARGLPLRRT